MTTIEQIKTALQTHIAEAEAATPGPWEIDDGDGYGALKLFADAHLTVSMATVIGDDAISEANATFIAHARTMSPLVCRGYLQTIEWLEEDASYTGELYCPGDEYAHGVEYGKSIIGVKAYRRLESIRQEWHNLTTKQ